jgi:hypothetical protein
MKVNIPLAPIFITSIPFALVSFPFFGTKASFPFHSEIHTKNSFCFGFVLIFIFNANKTEKTKE